MLKIGEGYYYLKGEMMRISRYLLGLFCLPLAIQSRPIGEILFPKHYAREGHWEEHRNNLWFEWTRTNPHHLRRSDAQVEPINELTLVNLWHALDDARRAGDAAEVNRLHTEIMRIKRILVNQYKIHLMPSLPYLEGVADALAYAITHDHAFEPLVSGMKILNRNLDVDPANRERNINSFRTLGRIHPVIAIYPTDGHTQEVLAYVARLLRGVPGLQHRELPLSMRDADENKLVSPEFNTVARARSGEASPLLYYAQGNGDFRRGDEYMSADEFNALYDRSDNFSLYRTDFLGGRNDFHLVLPDGIARAPQINPAALLRDLPVVPPVHPVPVPARPAPVPVVAPPVRPAPVPVIPMPARPVPIPVIVVPLVRPAPAPVVEPVKTAVAKRTLDRAIAQNTAARIKLNKNIARTNRSLQALDRADRKNAAQQRVLHRQLRGKKSLAARRSLHKKLQQVTRALNNAKKQRATLRKNLKQQTAALRVQNARRARLVKERARYPKI